MVGCFQMGHVRGQGDEGHVGGQNLVSLKHTLSFDVNLETVFMCSPKSTTTWLKVIFLTTPAT